MTVILLGLGLGGFLALTVYGINPPRASLADTLARLGNPRPHHCRRPWKTRRRAGRHGSGGGPCQL